MSQVLKTIQILFITEHNTDNEKDSKFKKNNFYLNRTIYHNKSSKNTKATFCNLRKLRSSIIQLNEKKKSLMNKIN